MRTLQAILRALADLSPTGGNLGRQVHDASSDGRPVGWFGTGIDVHGLFHPNPARMGWSSSSSTSLSAALGVNERLGLVDTTIPAVALGEGSRILRELLALDALHREERLIRAGWIWLCGPASIDGEPTRLLHPLLSVPVRAPTAISSGAVVQRAGDAELTPLATTHRTALESTVTFGPSIKPLSGSFRRTPTGWAPFEDDRARGVAHVPPARNAFTWNVEQRILRAMGLHDRPAVAAPESERALATWVERVVHSIGLPPVRIVGPRTDVAAARDGDELVAVVGVGLYLARATFAADIATSLANWSTTHAIATTAGAAVLSPAEARPPKQRRAQDEKVPSPLVLSAAQRDALRRARRDPVTVVTGPPGSGKSHAVAAIAIDAVARGERVLVAAPSTHAADALAELLARQPGPPPVLFGGSHTALDLAGELAAEGRRVAPTERVVADGQALDAAVGRRGQLTGHLRRQLGLAAAAERSAHLGALLPMLTARAPGLLDADLDPEALQSIAERASTPRGGPLGRLQRRRAERRLRRALGAGDGVATADLVRGIDAVAACRADASLRAAGGTVLGTTWGELWRADDEARHAAGALLWDRARAGPARAPAAQAAVQRLVTALHQPRHVRRAHLALLDSGPLLAALPLWVGSIDDIDDLLPARAGLFDLVILDEANSVDLTRAATAWLRATRSVVVGDPAQLRHVSFVGAEASARAFWRHGAGYEANRLDVGKVSALDAATAVAAPQWLDEHHRSVPHLIAFSARHFYERPIHLATRHPRNEGTDAIDTVIVAGHRTGRVVRDEVDAVRQRVREMVDAGWTSIGVMSPFRAQADALERMLVAELDLDRLRYLDLRVGTVHAFQGAERDAVVLSLGLLVDDPAGRRRFVEQPELFNVMVTRARHHLTVVHSLSPDGAEGGGLVASYLRHAEAPPHAPHDDPCEHPWTASLAAELERLGLECRTDYPVGRWTVDLVVLDPEDVERCAAIETRVHPGGAGPHIARHLQLRRARWQVMEAWPTFHHDDPVGAALTLADELRHPHPPTSPPP